VGRRRVAIMSMLRKLFKRGWRAVTEAHTIHWVFGGLLSLLPPAAATAAINYYGEHSLSILFIVFFIVFGIFILVLLTFLGYLAERKTLRISILNEAASLPTERSPLEINVGEDGPFYDVPKSTLYSFTRRLKIELRNNDRSKTAARCKIQITDINPDTGRRGPWVLKESFSLSAGDAIYIPLVSYNEARQPGISDYSDSEIEVCVEDRLAVPPAMQIKTANVITIRATTDDMPYCEAKCIVWKDRNGKLRIKKRSAAVQESRQGNASWPDFKKWDQKSEFELYEAACLWFDIEPQLPMPRKPQEKYQQWKAMILGGGLPVHSGNNIRNDIKVSMRDETAITPHLRIYRDVLVTVAEHDGEQPRFLYPHRRGESDDFNI
jgi:hypothetical protein